MCISLEFDTTTNPAPMGVSVLDPSVYIDTFAWPFVPVRSTLMWLPLGWMPLAFFFRPVIIALVGWPLAMAVMSLYEVCK